MDSINKNQPQENFKALVGEDAVEKLKQMGKDAPVCFFCTNIKKGQGFSTRPMSVQQVDDDGNFWFLSSADSNKNAELKSDKSVQLLFQESRYSDFLTIYGKASILKKKDKIKELWNPVMKAWFTEGEDDPRITVIKVSPIDGYYWDTKHGKFVAMLKTAVGAMVGKTLDDSIEGPVNV